MLASNLRRRAGNLGHRQLGLTNNGHALPLEPSESLSHKPAFDDFKPGPIGSLIGDVLKAGVDFVNGVLHQTTPGAGDQTGGGSGAGHDTPPNSPLPTPITPSYPPPAGGGASAAAPAASPPVRPPADAPSSSWPAQSPVSSGADTPPSGTSPTARPSGLGPMNVAGSPTLTGSNDEPAYASSSAPPASQTPWSGTLSITDWSSPSSTPPGNPSHAGNNSSSKSSHGFPLAAAAAIGAVLSFLVVSALIWGLWFYLKNRKRRSARRPHYVIAASKRGVSMAESMFTILSASTVPHFISAAEAGVKERKTRQVDASDPANPFAHPADGREEDPFDADDDMSSLRRASTQRTTSTLSV